MKKKIIIIIAALSAIAVLTLTVFAAVVLYKLIIPVKFVSGEDEIALYITLDTKEDVGLIVFDYTANGREFGGGVSNADRSMIKRDDVIINTWDRGQLECDADTVDLTFKFRIITEYTDPNYENVYPEEITRYLEPVSFKARFGTAYKVIISGDKTNGYKAFIVGDRNGVVDGASENSR
ncbi:MAG: hypothetical protein IJT49_01900 [Clostridia bacterium]|nr:hypothetical protein [Clostridia bacterium]